MGRRMKYTGNHEVEVPGKGVFEPGWTGEFDDQLINNANFEEVKEPQARKTKTKEDE